jgi:hypothetical protein
MIAGLHREVDENYCCCCTVHFECVIITDENCSLPSYYAASTSNFLQTFQDNLSVPSSRVKKMGLIGCLEMLVRNYHYLLHNNLEQRSSQPHMFCVTVRYW